MKNPWTVDREDEYVSKDSELVRGGDWDWTLESESHISGLGWGDFAPPLPEVAFQGTREVTMAPSHLCSGRRCPQSLGLALPPMGPSSVLSWQEMCFLKLGLPHGG